MIFAESTNAISINHESVQESPYDLGIGGALQHVYENECNYNALMKAAALSEATVLYNLVESITIGASLLESFMPETSEKILKELNTAKRELPEMDVFGRYPSGNKVITQLPEDYPSKD